MNRSISAFLKKVMFLAAAITVVACAALSACSNADRQDAAAESTDSAAAESADSSEPESTDDAEPESADSSEPESTDDAVSESADSSEPEGTDDAEPESADSSEPENIVIPEISTGYSEYDALIEKAQNVLIGREDYFEDEIEDNFNFSLCYIYAFYKIYESAGYTLLDLDGNGIEELIFGENGSGAWNGVIYDLYTIVDGELVHVFSGGERNRYYLCEDGSIANEGSDGAADSVDIYYTYEGTEMKLIEAVHFYNGSIYYSTENDYPGYYVEENESMAYREIEWEEVEEIEGKYVYSRIQFNRFIEILQEK